MKYQQILIVVFLINLWSVSLQASRAKKTIGIWSVVKSFRRSENDVLVRLAPTSQLPKAIAQKKESKKFHHILRKGDPIKIDQALDASPDQKRLLDTPYNRLFPLIMTTHTASDVARSFIFHGAKKNIQDEHGSTPLHHAAWNGYVVLVHELMQPTYLVYRYADGALLVQHENKVHDWENMSQEVVAIFEPAADPHAKNHSELNPLDVAILAPKNPEMASSRIHTIKALLCAGVKPGKLAQDAVQQLPVGMEKHQIQELLSRDLRLTHN